MFLCIVSQSSILTSRVPNGISLFRFWIFGCIENPHGSPLVALCAANLYRAELKDRRLVCSLEAEVGKGLPVSSIGQHLFVYQVHLEQSWKVLTVPQKKNSVGPTCWRVLGVRTFSPLKSIFSYLKCLFDLCKTEFLPGVLCEMFIFPSLVAFELGCRGNPKLICCIPGKNIFSKRPRGHMRPVIIIKNSYCILSRGSIQDHRNHHEI